MDRHLAVDLCRAMVYGSSPLNVLRFAALAAAVWFFPWGSVWALLILALALAAHYYFISAAPSLIYSSNSATEQRILRQMPCLRGRGYYPTPYLVNRHLQTLFAALGRPLPDVPFLRQLNFDVFPDGEVCVVDWAFSNEWDLQRWQALNTEQCRASAAPLQRSGDVCRHRSFKSAADYATFLAKTRDRPRCVFQEPGPHVQPSLDAFHRDMVLRMRSGRPPVVIIFHGLTGGSEDNNVYHLTKWALRKGWHVAVPVRRGCANSSQYLTGSKHYAYGGLEDTAHVVNHICDSMPEHPVLAVGLSAGSNVMTNYVAIHGHVSRIYGAVSVANGYCWERGTAAIRDKHPVWDVVMSAMVSSTLYHRHKDKIWIPVADDPGSPTRRAVSMREYDERVSRAIHGFDSLSEFYAEQSCIHRLHKIKQPMVFLNALDDPLADGSVIPYDALLRNPNTLLVCTWRGGHLGWASGWWPFRSAPTFMDVFVVEALAALLNEAAHRATQPPPTVTSTLNTAVEG